MVLEGREKVSEGCAISEAGSSGFFACFQGVYGPFFEAEENRPVTYGIWYGSAVCEWLET